MILAFSFHSAKRILNMIDGNSDTFINYIKGKVLIMAYIIGTVVWLIAIGFSILLWYSTSGIFEILGYYIATVVGIGSTVLFVLYLLLVFFYKRKQMSVFWLLFATFIVLVLLGIRYL